MGACFCRGGPNCCIEQQRQPVQCPQCGTWFTNQHRCSPPINTVWTGHCCICSQVCYHLGGPQYCYFHSSGFTITGIGVGSNGNGSGF